MTPWTVAALALLLPVSRALARHGKMILPPPQNLTLVSKDFNLFLTWLPGSGYSTGVFYTVQWRNVYRTWENFLPCTNISETVCNITCTSPDVFNKFDVRVKAERNAGTISSEWVNLENIEYEMNVTLAPPALWIMKIKDIIRVNATFSDPLCLNAIFRDLTSDLEIWEAGAKNRKQFTMENIKDFNATIFNSGTYCFSAQAVLNNVRSNFSEPTCIHLHSEADTWAFAAVPVLLLFISFVCIILSLYRWTSRPKTVKSPQALDFSHSKCQKKVLDFNEKEFISVFICSGHPVVVENRSRVTPQLVPSVLEEYEEEEEEEEEDTDNARPYTEMHRFPGNNIHSQMVDLDEKEHDPCSESSSSQLSESSMSDLTMPQFLVLTSSIFGEMTSGFQSSDMTLLSASFSSEQSSVCSDSYPVARREEQEDLDNGTDFLLQLSDSNLPAGKLFLPSESFCEANCRIPQISLFGEQSNQDFRGLLSENEKLSENDSCGCRRPVVELSPFKLHSREGLENHMLGRNRELIEDSSPEPKSHGYRPRPVHYLSRVLQR